MAPPTIYQIEFSKENIGKTKNDTKRRLKWIYAIGTTDRHEVLFTWSTVSGKQHVTINGETVISQQWQRTVFNEKMLTTSRGHPIELRLVCTRTMPTGAHPNFRQYELLINDRPYFTYPRLDGKGFAVEADTPERPMSVLGLLYPGKYYNSGRSACSGMPKGELDATMVLSDDDEEESIPAVPKIASVSDKDSAIIDAPFDEHE